MMRPALRELSPGDRDRLTALLGDRWGSTRMVSRGRIWEIPEMSGFIVEDAEGWLSYGTYRIDGDSCELVILDSLREGSGGGSAILEAVASVARSAGCRRLWLVTTNDNVHALRFYQRRGFVLIAVHRDAVTQARRTLKPEIGMVGESGIPIRDELELELEL